LIAWGVFEVASSAYDSYNAASTVMDPCLHVGVKAAAVGGALLGVVAPGGGYGTAGAASAKGLPDAALVCRGGACKAENFLNGSGVTRGPMEL